MFCVSRCEAAWKCTVGSWYGDYSPCCFALTLITSSNYFLYESLATVFPDHSFSTDYGYTNWWRLHKRKGITVSILPLRVLHVRSINVRVCKIQIFFFFLFGFFAISNIHYLKLFRCSLGSSRYRMSTVLNRNYLHRAVDLIQLSVL